MVMYMLLYNYLISLICFVCNLCSFQE